tara:strand:- start:2097 stop:2831 length:735 start_codon:yes stop_codon:yes gene_type:complete
MTSISENNYFVGVIPARFHSERFPGKILELIDGIPMVAHVYERAKESLLNTVVVAVDDKKALRTMEELRIPVIMTSKNHNSGTERVAEVARSIDGGVFVNIQGDEPFIKPEIINLVINEFRTKKEINMATVASTNLSSEDFDNPDVVKVNIRKDGTATTFFRNSNERTALKNCAKHIGIYGFKKEFLLQLVNMKRTSNEMDLNLEQMRALDNGFEINIAITALDSIGINRPEDLKKLKEIMTFA